MAKTKLFILDFGRLVADSSWFFHLDNIAAWSNKNPTNQTKEICVLGSLIAHPAGNILFDTGMNPEAWPEMVRELFYPIKHDKEHTLETILKNIGFSVKDISCVIISHLHLDHTGGLKLFKDAGTPIFVHEEQIKWGLYSAATRDGLAYMPPELDLSLNWKPIHEEVTEFAKDVYLYHVPGHVPGVLAMRIKLDQSGEFLFTSDASHLRENFEEERVLGWLCEDRMRWLKSVRKLKGIAKEAEAKVVFGHDAQRLEELRTAPKYYE
jgi:glyoxylase-like metal-dependent hydrolase (beta-lactamase superfamily II)